MSIAIYSFSLITIAFSIFSVILRILRGRKNNMVFHTDGFWITNIISIYFSVMLSVFYYRNEDGNTLFPFALTMALTLIANIAFFNGIIVFEEDSFFVRNFWGLKKYYSYTDITGFMFKKQRYRYTTETKAIFYAENKKFSVVTSNYNYHIFFEKISSEYKKLNGGKKLPQLKNKP